MKHIERLEKDPIRKLLISFSLPSIIGMLVNALYNVVDRIYVGQGVGTAAMSALSVIFPVFLIIFGLIMLVGAGGGALISLYLGEKKKDEAEKVISTGILMMAGVSAIALVPGLLFTEQILTLAGMNAEAMPYGITYLKTILIFTPFQFVAWGLNSFIRSSGNPMRSMYSMLAGAVINIILDPIFIFGFGMGIKGAAVATGISYIVTAIWNVGHFFSPRTMFRLSLSKMKLDGKIVLKILKIGFPMFVTQSIACLFNFVLNRQILAYGGDRQTIAQAAIGVIYGFNMLFFMPLLGLNMGIQPIIGYNYGAKLFDRVKKTLLLALAAGTALTTFCFLLCQIFPEQIFTMFNRSDTELMEFGSRMMRIVMVAFPTAGLQVICTGYFQSVGRAKEAFFMSVLKPVFVMIPLLFLLPLRFSLNGVFYALPISDFIAAAAMMLIIIIEIRKTLSADNGLNRNFVPEPAE